MQFSGALLNQGRTAFQVRPSRLGGIEQLRERARASVKEFGGGVDESAFARTEDRHRRLPAILNIGCRYHRR